MRRVAIHLLFGQRSLIRPVLSDVVVVAMDTKCYSMRQCACGGKNALRLLDGRRRPENRLPLVRLEPREKISMNAKQQKRRRAAGLLELHQATVLLD